MTNEEEQFLRALWKVAVAAEAFLLWSQVAELEQGQPRPRGWKELDDALEALDELEHPDGL